MPKAIDLTGQTFFKLTVQTVNRTIKKDALYWNCICTCGQICVVRGACLRSGNVKSCGCAVQDWSTTGNARRTHAMSDTPLYNTWSGMRARTCPDYWQKHPCYKGVNCSPVWSTFESFRDNQPAGRPYELGLVLSRYNDIGDYSPDNCRYLTKSENAKECNVRCKVRLLDGRFMLEVAKENGITLAAARNRRHRGWTPEEVAGVIARIRPLTQH